MRLPPGRARLATRPSSTGSPPTMKTIGIVEVAFFAASAAGSAARHDHIDLAADEVGGQGGQPIIATLRPAVFDRHVLSLDIAGFAQSLAERGHIRCRRAGRPAAEEADHRHRLLLRAEGRRPYGRRRRRSAKKGAELAPPHPSLRGSDRPWCSASNIGRRSWRVRLALYGTLLRSNSCRPPALIPRNVRSWPDSDLPARPLFRRSWGRSGHQSANASGRDL